MEVIEADADDGDYGVGRPEDEDGGGEEEETTEPDYTAAPSRSRAVVTGKNDDVLGLGLCGNGVVIGLRRRRGMRWIGGSRGGHDGKRWRIG